MAKALDINVEQSTNPLLEQVAGKGRGRVFELSIDEINLGRDDNNDIVISDDSVSRHHATIERQSDGSFVIADNDSKNGIIINKNKVMTCRLEHNDIIQLGHFVFRFKAPGGASSGMAVSQSSRRDEKELVSNPQNNSGQKKRLIMWGGLLIFIAIMWMLNNSSTEPSKEGPVEEAKSEEKFKPTAMPELKDNVKTSMSVDLEDPLTRIDKQISDLENKDSAIKESEIYFKKGQRDFFNKNYRNAIDNFNAAISLWNRHPLATYYRGLALHDSEVEAEKNFNIAIKYYNSLQYQRAVYHFRLVIDFLSYSNTENGPARQLVEQSKKYIDFSQRKLKAMELVP
jgi:pSer/pThr/pTyr-binding forkhead associated (FHA) protein